MGDSPKLIGGGLQERASIEGGMAWSRQLLVNMEDDEQTGLAVSERVAYTRKTSFASRRWEQN